MRIDEFIGARKPGKNERKVKKKKRLRETSLDAFLPEEHVEYFRQLRIGSKRIRNSRVEEL